MVLTRQKLVPGRALSQLRTGPHGGRLSQSKLVTQWCYPGRCWSPMGRYHSSGLVLTGEGYHSPSWSPSGANTARLTPDTGRALSQLRTGPLRGRLSQSKLVTQRCYSDKGTAGPVGRYRSTGLVLTGGGYHSPRWSPSGVIPARAMLVTGRALSQLGTGPHGGRLSQSKLVTQWLTQQG